MLAPAADRLSSAAYSIREGGDMSTFSARPMRRAPAGPAAPPPKRSIGAGLDQRSARDRSKPKAVEAKGSASPIRAWRAAEPGASETAREAQRAAANAARHPFGGDGGSGPRRSTTERAARMRAIEQAWRDERARQAESEGD
jgi:hypothetical protein